MWDPQCGTKTIRKIKESVGVGVFYKSINLCSKNKNRISCYKKRNLIAMKLRNVP